MSLNASLGAERARGGGRECVLGGSSFATGGAKWGFGCEQFGVRRAWLLRERERIMSGW